MTRYLLISLIFFFSLGARSQRLAHDFIDELPRTSKVIPDFSYTELLKQLDSQSLHHIEGIWQFPADGVEIAIVRRDMREPAVYNMIMLKTPRRAARPGTVVGLVTRAGKTGVYDAKIYTRARSSVMFSPKKFRLNLSENDTHIVFEQRKNRFSFNFWRLLPFSLRYTVRRNEPEKSTTGCLRIYPAPSRPYEKVYL